MEVTEFIKENNMTKYVTFNDTIPECDGKLVKVLSEGQDCYEIEGIGCIAKECFYEETGEFDDLVYKHPLNSTVYSYWYIYKKNLTDSQIQFLRSCFNTDYRWGRLGYEDVVMGTDVDNYIWTNSSRLVNAQCKEVTFNDIFVKSGNLENKIQKR